MSSHYRLSNTFSKGRLETISGPLWIWKMASTRCLLEECRYLTAFCTPAGTFEWKVLPMWVEAGPQAFRRLVSWCVGRLKPHIRAYIDDTLVGTQPTRSGEGRLLNSQAIMEHYKLVRGIKEVPLAS